MLSNKSTRESSDSIEGMMSKDNGTKWTDEVSTNRVSVFRNANSLRVSIKAPEFSMGNNFLTLCITLGFLVEGVLVYLMIKSNVNLAILVPSFIFLGAGLGIGFVKLWLWHNFGEELINIKGNSFEMHRSYGLFNGDAKQLILNRNSELYINRNDIWSWKEFRGKGIFRLATVDAALTDFGLKLNDQEFELIVRPVSEQLEKLKNQPEGMQFSAEQKEREALSVIEPEVSEGVEEVIQPPNLAQQTGGQHRAALNDYLGKAAGKETTSESESSKIKKKAE